MKINFLCLHLNSGQSIQFSIFFFKIMLQQACFEKLLVKRITESRNISGKLFYCQLYVVFTKQTAMFCVLGTNSICCGWQP